MSASVGRLPCPRCHRTTRAVYARIRGKRVVVFEWHLTGLLAKAITTMCPASEAQLTPIDLLSILGGDG